MKNPFRVIVLVLSGLALSNAHAQSGLESAAPTQPESATAETTTSKTPRDPALAPDKAKKIEEERKREEAFVPTFLELPPKKRVAKWLKLSHLGRKQRLDDALVVFGTDAVPWLANLVRNGRKASWTEDSTHAVQILCDMDRFVPSDQFPLHDVSSSVHVPSRNAEGLVNSYVPVDGRRIGTQGYDAVKWASEQTDNRRLRFYTRYFSGLLEQDFQQLPLEAQVREWADATKCNNAAPCRSPQSEMRVRVLADLLAQRAPDSIPLLVNLMAKESNGFVRLDVVNLLEKIDSSRMRLNATDVGRGALTAALNTVNPTNVKRMFPMAWLQSGLNMNKEMEARNALWKQVTEMQSDDHVSDALLMNLTIYFRAFAQFHGDSTRAKFDRTGEIVATPEIREFVVFLTKTDPYFPSWEYPARDKSMAADQILHPRFRAKVDRYYAQWKQFEQSTAAAQGEQ